MKIGTKATAGSRLSTGKLFVISDPQDSRRGSKLFDSRYREWMLKRNQRKMYCHKFQPDNHASIGRGRSKLDFVAELL